MKSLICLRIRTVSYKFNPSWLMHIDPLKVVPGAEEPNTVFNFSFLILLPVSIIKIEFTPGTSLLSGNSLFYLEKSERLGNTSMM